MLGAESRALSSCQLCPVNDARGERVNNPMFGFAGAGRNRLRDAAGASAQEIRQEGI